MWYLLKNSALSLCFDDIQIYIQCLHNLLKTYKVFFLVSDLLKLSAMTGIAMERE